MNLCPFEKKQEKIIFDFIKKIIYIIIFINNYIKAKIKIMLIKRIRKKIIAVNFFYLLLFTKRNLFFESLSFSILFSFILFASFIFLIIFIS